MEVILKVRVLEASLSLLEGDGDVSVDDVYFKVMVKGIPSKRSAPGDRGPGSVRFDEWLLFELPALLPVDECRMKIQLFRAVPGERSECLGQTEWTPVSTEPYAQMRAPLVHKVSFQGVGVATVETKHNTPNSPTAAAAAFPLSSTAPPGAAATVAAAATQAAASDPSMNPGSLSSPLRRGPSVRGGGGGPQGENIGLHRAPSRRHSRRANGGGSGSDGKANDGAAAAAAAAAPAPRGLSAYLASSDPDLYVRLLNLVIQLLSILCWVNTLDSALVYSLALLLMGTGSDSLYNLAMPAMFACTALHSAIRSLATEPSYRSAPFPLGLLVRLLAWLSGGRRSGRKSGGAGAGGDSDGPSERDNMGLVSRVVAMRDLAASPQHRLLAGLHVTFSIGWFLTGLFHHLTHKTKVARKLAVLAISLGVLYLQLVLATPLLPLSIVVFMTVCPFVFSWNLLKARLPWMPAWTNLTPAFLSNTHTTFRMLTADDARAAEEMAHQLAAYHALSPATLQAAAAQAAAAVAGGGSGGGDPSSPGTGRGGDGRSLSQRGSSPPPTHHRRSSQPVALSYVGDAAVAEEGGYEAAAGAAAAPSPTPAIMLPPGTGGSGRGGGGGGGGRGSGGGGGDDARRRHKYSHSMPVGDLDGILTDLESGNTTTTTGKNLTPPRSSERQASHSPQPRQVAASESAAAAAPPPAVAAAPSLRPPVVVPAATVGASAAAAAAAAAAAVEDEGSGRPVYCVVSMPVPEGKETMAALQDLQRRKLKGQATGWVHKHEVTHAACSLLHSLATHQSTRHAGQSTRLYLLPDDFHRSYPHVEFDAEAGVGDAEGFSARAYLALNRERDLSHGVRTNAKGQASRGRAFEQGLEAALSACGHMRAFGRPERLRDFSFSASTTAASVLAGDDDSEADRLVSLSYVAAELFSRRVTVVCRPPNQGSSLLFVTRVHPPAAPPYDRGGLAFPSAYQPEYNKDVIPAALLRQLTIAACGIRTSLRSLVEQLAHAKYAYYGTSESAPFALQGSEATPPPAPPPVAAPAPAAAAAQVKAAHHPTSAYPRKAAASAPSPHGPLAPLPSPPVKVPGASPARDRRRSVAVTGTSSSSAEQNRKRSRSAAQSILGFFKL